jgi:nucleosome binding factor SPN SPT16 subunit
MKTINDDPKAFFEEAGGWGFLNADGGSDGSMTESEESEFEMSGASDAPATESDSDASDDSGVVSDSDASSGSGSALSGEESGQDWDDLEKQAAKADQKKRDREDGFDSDEGQSKKHHSKGHSKHRH